MSRFLSSYRRLQKKIVKLEMDNMTGDIGPCLIEYARSGTLPAQEWLRAKVLYLVNTARAMDETIPKPPAEDKGAESS
jgi:hypothetical protein